MATKIQNNKNFLIVEVSWKEYVALTDSWGIADCCGQNTIEEKLYYIAVLDQFYCKPCFDAWYSGVKKYKSDLEKEQMNFIKIKHKLEDLGTWE